MNKERINILRALVQEIRNPRQKMATGIIVSKKRGIMLLVKERKRFEVAGDRGYIWFDIPTCIELGLIPDNSELYSNDNNLNNWLNANVTNKSFYIKVPRLHRKVKLIGKRNQGASSSRVNKQKELINYIKKNKAKIPNARKHITAIKKKNIKNVEEFREHLKKSA